MKINPIVFLFFLMLGLCACSNTNKIYLESEEGEGLETNSNSIPMFETSLKVDKKVPIESEVNNEKLKDKIFGGNYFDESVYKYIDIPESESPLVYCEILISNITDNSFDFIIYEIVMATGERKVLMSTSSAEFQENGSNAICHGENLTLYFTFPDDQETFPKHLKISGLEQTEGKIYINNTIPGHESG